MKRILLSLLMMTLLLTSGCVSQASAAPPPSYNTGVNPDSWVTVPAGEFLMGEHNDPTLISYDYEIMVTDVTNAQYAKYLNEALAAEAVKIETVDNQLGVFGYYPGDVFHGGRHEVEITAGDKLLVPLNNTDLRLVYDESTSTFSVKSSYENHPMTVVTWFGAWAYCDFYGYRLPTEAEWEKAARGPAVPAWEKSTPGTDERSFPWGDEIKRNNANYYDSRDPFEKVAGKQGDTTPVGFYNGGTYDGYQTLNSPSPYGLYDMAGNVWQWTGNVYEGTAERYLRGGSMREPDFMLRVYSRNSVRPDYYSPSFGFRCVR